MSGFALMSNFACDACGSPAIVLPEQLHESSMIRCSGCGGELGSWGAFKQHAKELILSDVAQGRCDPRVAGVDLALKI